MDSEIIEIEWWRLVTAYIFVILLLVILKWRSIHREKDVLIATIRMSVQLVLAGFILEYIFNNEHPLLTIGVLVLMVGFAIFTAIRRIKHDVPPQMKKLIAISLTIGVSISLSYFIFVVIGLSPWYKATYVIPIAGMIVGNAMTGITLGVNTYMNEMASKSQLVEGALMLGATPKEATRAIANRAFDAAMTPILNNMIGMGIVFLPGLMTGQILGGASPLVSINYQIAIMLGILGAVALSVVFFAVFGYKTFFNDRDQLIDMQ